MMIIWRYLLLQYIKVLSLTVVTFIAILLTTRLNDIAHFASLGAEGLSILFFALQQIPYVLPIVIPISALISALLLIQRLSSSSELTALRASGLSIKMILTPVLIFSAYLSLLNFYIVSEVATESHLNANRLKHELRLFNPLLVLHNKHMMGLKGIYFDSYGESKIGETASDALIAMPGKGDKGIHLIVAKNLKTDLSNFSASHLTLVTSEKKGEEEMFDQLMVENIAHSTTSIEDFAKMVEKKIVGINNDQLNLKLLLQKIGDENKELLAFNNLSPKEGATKIDEMVKDENPISFEKKKVQRNLNRSYSEINRRLSIALAVFTFTLMGLSFGVKSGRIESNRKFLSLICLTTLYLTAYFIAKSIEYQFTASAILYLVPHLLILIFSFNELRKLSRGMG